MHPAKPPLCLDDERVRKVFEAGRRAHPGVDLSRERLAPLVKRARPHHDNADFYLAVACDFGAPGAWERLQDRYRRPLRALLRRRGADRADVEALLEDVWGRLASPPPRGGARTRIGTYDGQGPLLAWLSTVAWRRLADVWRKRGGVAPLDEGADVAPWYEADPARDIEEDEAARLVGGVLEAAWASLTDRELEVVVLKYRHLLPQKEIARILRIGPPRVTRLLQSAARRLREAVAARFELRAYAGSADSNQAALLEILQRMLSQGDAFLEGAGRRGKGSA